MRSRFHVLSLAVAALGVLLTVAGGCTSDCANYCERVKECIDPSIDVTHCTDVCGSYADESATNAGRVEDCSACVDGKTCAEATSGSSGCVGTCLLVPTR